MTALASMRALKNFDTEFAVTNRLRTEGTEHLIAAAKAAGTRRLLVQSFTAWPNSRAGNRIKSEEDPLDSDPPKTMAKSRAAIRELERRTLNPAGMIGAVLRCGSFYRPGTSIARSEIEREALRWASLNDLSLEQSIRVLRRTKTHPNADWVAAALRVTSYTAAVSTDSVMELASALPLGQGYDVWRKTLRTIARGNRSRALTNLGALVSWIATAGGTETIERTADAVERVIEWWP